MSTWLYGVCSGLIILFSAYNGGSVVVGVGAALGVLAFVFVRHHTPMLSKAGRQMRRRVLGFRRFLRKMNRTTPPSPDELHDTSLPYLTAFGINTHWTRSFTRAGIFELQKTTDTDPHFSEGSKAKQSSHYGAAGF